MAGPARGASAGPVGEPVALGPSFVARLGALRVRLEAARRAREGAGRSSLPGAGQDLVGFRPYRPGEDLRQLDWNLLARHERPFVRVTRREAGERWAVVLDASASMGVGEPPKLQRAAECAAALVALGQARGAQVELLVSGPEVPASVGVLVGPRDGLDAVLGALEGLTRVLVLGDLADLGPGDVLGMRRGGRELRLCQLLAPEELDPPLGGALLVDPEGGEPLRLEVDEGRRRAYQLALEAELEGWRELAGRHGFRHAGRSTAEPFEVLVEELLRR
jgi:uncharacterized protein (DUF58 family)